MAGYCREGLVGMYARRLRYIRCGHQIETYGGQR